MARVNRTTGVFLILGLALLIGTVAGALSLSNPKAGDGDVEDLRPQDVWARGRIDVSTRVLTPVPGVPAGVIASVDVKEGEEVKAGTVLYKLDDRMAQAKLDEAKIGVLAAKQKQDAAKAEVREYKSKVALQKGAVELAQVRWDQASEVYRSLEDKNKKIGGLDLELKSAELAVRAAYKAFKLEEFKLKEMELQDPEKLTLAAADLQLKAAELALASAQRLVEQHVVKSPCNGFVTTLSLSVGESFPVMPSGLSPRPAIVVQPDVPLVVRAEIEQSRARFLRPGMAVTIRDHDPSNNQTWEGEVESLSRWVMRPKSFLIEPDQVNDARSREVVIRLKGNMAEFPFVVGSDVRVQIHINGK
jgi:multidrug resistance efflux pump